MTRERSFDDRRRTRDSSGRREKLREVNALYAGQGARMSKLLSRYSADEFRLVMEFLEQTNAILWDEVKPVRVVSE